jgi:hypothetical protein
MARTPNTQHDVTITKMLGQSRSVTEIARSLGLSDPTVYKAIHRLGLALPTKAAARSTTATAEAEPAAKKAVKVKTRKASAPAATKRAAVKRPAQRNAEAVATAAPVASSVPSVELVPVAQAQDLLTVRVEKGVELLKNLSARIVKNERELATLRQRYADTLAALALN